MEIFEKAQTVDPEVRAYIYSLVNAVGGQSTLDDDRYQLGDDAHAVLNDLLRWLRLYDEKTNRFDVKRCLAESNLVKGDLLEILALWPEQQQDNKLKAKLALSCLQLLVPLTWPVELEEDTTTVNNLRHAPFLQLTQVGYKRAVLQYEDAAILRTVIRAGLPCMAVNRRERTKRDDGIIKLVLYFLRNIAMITQPQHLPVQGDENEISRSATIETFQAQDVFSLLLTVGSGAADEFQEQNVIILETLFHLLKGVDAKKLFMQQSQLATHETDELRSLMLKEKAMLNSYNKHAPTRHNRFGTMLWVKREDSKLSTVTGQTSITNESTTLHQMDQSKKWDKPKYRGKLTHEFNENSEFGMRVELTEKARMHLRVFIEDFLDSSFNPLFASLRKSIEREEKKVLSSHLRQYFYLISWFLSAESARREVAKANRPNHSMPNSGEEGNTYAYIAAVLDEETFVLLNRHQQNALDSKQWQDLHTTLLAFTQILLTVQDMSESKDEEDQEIAENIQNRIFYHESTHDRMVQILRGYTHQGFAYLDAVTECVHVFIRMIEKYSKINVDLQIRSKRRKASKKKKKTNAQQPEAGIGEEQTAQPEGGVDDPVAADNDSGVEDELEEQELHRAASERKFDFARFSAKFLNQPCLNTFVSLLTYYADLNPAQLKRCHRFLYRLAFKHELVVLCFRVDILALFQKLIKGPGGLDKDAVGKESWKEWESLVQQVFRRCIKWLERSTEGEGWREAAVVEMLFSKIPGTMFYLQNGFERVVEKRAPRPPAELEVKGSVDEVQRVPVVVSIMLELGKGGDLEWVKRQLSNAAEERKAWEDEHAARAVVSPAEPEADSETAPAAEAPAAPTIFLAPDSEERKDALFKDKYLRLLLTTLGLQRLGEAEDTSASWIIPSELAAKRLQESLEQIRKTEFDPPAFEDGKAAQDLIRNKSASRRAAAFDDSLSSADENEDETLFPPNLREKRKNVDGDDEAPKKKRRLTRRNRTELTDAQAQAKADERARKEREKNRKIKSNLFITASDDESDEERDREFFALEEQRRKKMKGIIRSQLLKEQEKEGGKQSKKAGKQSEDITNTEESDEDVNMHLGISDDESDVDSLDGNATHALRRLAGERNGLNVETNSPLLQSIESDDELEEAVGNRHADRVEGEETPSTSPPALGQPDQLPLNELSSNIGVGKTVTAPKGMSGEMDVDENEEDDAPIRKPATQRRNVRAGFIIEDDSEDE